MPGGSFKPGERVPTSGIYTALHHQHRIPHQVFAVEGEEFPVCRKCGDNLRFGLFQAAGHIDLDHDFSKAAAAARASRDQSDHKPKPRAKSKS
jgi:hypothetical protein